jgi:hypothetical protein
MNLLVKFGVETILVIHFDWDRVRLGMVGLGEVWSGEVWYGVG